MLAPPQRTVSIGGVEMRIKAPETTKAVLEMEMWHTTHWVEETEGEGNVPFLADIRPMARWCAHHVVSIESEASQSEWRKLNERERTDAVERICNNQTILELKNAIVELVCFDQDRVDQIEEFYFIKNDEGCECPMCEHDMERSEVKSFLREQCRYNAVSERNLHIASYYGGLDEEDLLEAPYFIYQVHCAASAGESRAFQKEQEEEETRQEAHEKTRQMLGAPQ